MTNSFSLQILPEINGIQKFNLFYSVNLLLGIEAGSELSAQIEKKNKEKY